MVPSTLTSATPGSVRAGASSSRRRALDAGGHGAHVLLGKQGEALTRHGAGQRVGHEGGAVHHHSCLAARYGVGHLAGGHHGAQGQVAASEPFAHGHYVGLHSGPLPRKGAACAPEAGGYLVEDEVDAVAVAQFAGFAQILRMVKPHASCALHHRLKDHGGYLAPFLFEQIGQGAMSAGSHSPSKRLRGCGTK